jgi:uncharacterized protein (DUF427 family)
MKTTHLFKLTLISVALSLWSCGGGGGGDDTPPTPQPNQNRAPGTPTLSAPENNILCIDNVVQFSWTNVTDPDGDQVSYELQIATNSSFTENVQNIPSSTNSTSVALDKGVAYYWRVKAKDTKNASSNYTTGFSFYTEGEGEKNYLPFAPSLVSPSLNSIIQETSVTLEWDADDVDNDPLTFTVYFGSDNPPANAVVSDSTEKTYTVELSAQTNYYWKVVVKDDKGGQTEGQVWGFKTD